MSKLKVVGRILLLSKFGLCPLAFSDSEFDFWNLWIYFWAFGRTPRTGDRPVARPLPTQDTHSCLKQDSNPLVHIGSG